MEAPNTTATRIIVQNLSFGTTQDDLAAFFRAFVGSDAEVTDVLVASDPTGRSKGFGFVTFATNASLQKALADTSLELDGRPLRVQIANQRKDDKEKRGGGRAPREIKASGPKLYCGDLPWELSASELAEHFEQYGKVEDAYLAEVQYAAQVNGYKPHRGFGFVVFSSEAEATKALVVNKHVVKGTTIRVTSAKGTPSERKPREPREPRNNNNKGDKQSSGDAPTSGGGGKKAGKGATGGNNDGAQERKAPAKEGGKEAAPSKKPAAAPPVPASGASPARKAGVKIPAAPKANPWNKKGSEAADAVSTEDYPSLADVASGKVKAKVVEDDAPPTDSNDKGKEEAQ